MSSEARGAPLVDPVAERETPPQQAKSNLVPYLGNFSVQYNFTSASCALKIVGATSYFANKAVSVETESDIDKDLDKNIVFAGAALGMLLMGRLGDVLGRTRAMTFTLMLTVLGAIIPACAAGSEDIFWPVVLVGRAILGIGVGGIYPLSAVKSAEGAATVTGRGKRVGMAFFGQACGQAGMYVVAMFLLWAINPEEKAKWVPQLQFRLLFFIGAIPAVIVLIKNRTEEDSAEATATHQQQGAGGTVARAPIDRRSKLTLIGTAGAWFLYDVNQYGVQIFTPNIIQAIYGKDISLMRTFVLSFVTAAVGVPACLAAIQLIDRFGCRYMNMIGFVGLSGCFIASALCQDANDNIRYGLLILTNAFLNFGPNLGTYVLPAICFPASVRSTCHGISAFGGKFGAFVGTVVFVPLLKNYGLTTVMWVEFVIAILGTICSFMFLKNDWDYLDDEDRTATKAYVEGARSRSFISTTGSGVAPHGA